MVQQLARRKSSRQHEDRVDCSLAELLFRLTDAWMSRRGWRAVLLIVFQDKCQLIIEDLWCERLATNARGTEVFEALKNFFEPYGLSWNHRVGLCVDDTKAGTDETTEILAPRQEQTVPAATVGFAAVHRPLRGKMTAPVSLYDGLDEAIRPTDLVNLKTYACLFFFFFLAWLLNVLHNEMKSTHKA